MIYVLGSLNMDMVAKVAYMPVNGETMSAEKFYTNCGGKGNNQAVAIAKLGGKVAMIGKVGSDANGKVMKDNLPSVGMLKKVTDESDESNAFITFTIYLN